MPEWDPEVEVDAERAHALIAAQFPELATATVREIAAGWDNVVHLVDNGGPSAFHAGRSLFPASAARSRCSDAWWSICHCRFLDHNGSASRPTRIRGPGSGPHICLAWSCPRPDSAMTNGSSSERN